MANACDVWDSVSTEEAVLVVAVAVAVVFVVVVGVDSDFHFQHFHPRLMNLVEPASSWKVMLPRLWRVIAVVAVAVVVTS